MPASPLLCVRVGISLSPRSGGTPFLVDGIIFAGGHYHDVCFGAIDGFVGVLRFSLSSFVVRDAMKG